MQEKKDQPGTKQGDFGKTGTPGSGTGTGAGKPGGEIGKQGGTDWDKEKKGGQGQSGEIGRTGGTTQPGQGQGQQR